MDGPGPGVKVVENETKSQAARTTAGGKKYTYFLNVIQQPLRARACGAGAKSSADRRPVDPPPIVELKIFEDCEGGSRDVTFCMNANYFLFATLEQARHIAPGRAVQDRGLTVLTGTPVAGMVCLDRPTPAGYFIFPDLSVRHEGKYRLSFSLYEELKPGIGDEGADDPSKPNDQSDTCVTHRLEVKSLPFTVYSAKKFPGLTESTSLSRVVAEQGCRVRIRRDVRMRKREGKNGKEWDGYEEETAEARARMSATPEVAGYPLSATHGYGDPIVRPRSGSNVSHHSHPPSLSISRRPSMQEMNQAHHASVYGTSPHTPQTAYPQTSPYGPSPTQSYPQPPFIQQPSTMQPPPPQFQQQPYHAPAQVPQPASSHQGYYGYASAHPPPPAVAPNQFGPPPPQQSGYEPQEHLHRMSVDYTPHYAPDHHRTSSQYSAPPPPASQPNYAPRGIQDNFPHQQSALGQPPPTQAQQSMYGTQQPSAMSLDGYSNSHRPAPLEPVQPPTRTTGVSTPLSGRPLFSEKPLGKQLPPINTLEGMNSKLLEPSSPSSAAPQSGYFGPSTGSQMNSHKRGHGQVFNDRHQYQRLSHGARPSTPVHQFYPLSAEADDNDNEGPIQYGRKAAYYRRADGRPAQRPLQQQY